MSEWKTVRLGDVCEILDSKRVPITAHERKNGSYPYYGANGIQDYVADYIFDDELVLLAEDGGNFGSKEKPIAYRVSGKCWVNNHAHVLKPKECLDVDYLCDSIKFYDVSTIVNGATRQKLTQSAMVEMKIFLPPLETQKQIAAQLDKCTSIITKHKQMLEKYDTLIKSRFIEMFGDPVANPMGWEVNQLSDFIIFLTSGARGWSEYFSKEGDLFLTIKNVKNNKIKIDDVQHIKVPSNKEAERTKVKENDLLISITADLGRTGVVSKAIASYGAYINQHLSLVRLNMDKINPLFVSYFLETEGGKIQFSKKNQSAVKAGLNFDAIKSLHLINPPLSLQNDFASFVQQIDKSKFAVQKSLEKTETLYKSLMQQYFA